MVAVKANQKRLYKQIQLNTQQTTPISVDISTEHRSDLRFAAALRYRLTTRTVSVFDNLTDISSEWVGLERLVKVERIGTRAGKPYEQVAYYISSLRLNAAQFAQGIRGHWGIENRLHWVKDVVLEEDSSRIRLGNAPANLSIIRSLAIAILRNNGYSSITTAVRMIAHNLEQIFLLFGKVRLEA